MFTPRELIDMAQALGSDIDLGNATREEIFALIEESFRLQIDAILS